MSTDKSTISAEEFELIISRAKTELEALSKEKITQSIKNTDIRNNKLLEEAQQHTYLYGPWVPDEMKILVYRALIEKEHLELYKKVASHSDLQRFWSNYSRRTAKYDLNKRVTRLYQLMEGIRLALKFPNSAWYQLTPTKIDKKLAYLKRHIEETISLINDYVDPEFWTINPRKEYTELVNTIELENVDLYIYLSHIKPIREEQTIQSGLKRILERYKDTPFSSTPAPKQANSAKSKYHYFVIYMHSTFMTLFGTPLNQSTASLATVLFSDVEGVYPTEKNVANLIKGYTKAENTNSSECRPTKTAES